MTMTSRRILFFAIPALAAALSWPALGDEKEKQEEQAEIQKNVKETLDRLYAAQPEAKNAVAKSAGYAVFSAFGTKILVAGGGSGKGLAKNNKAGATTYMKMVEVQAGLGMGVKKAKGTKYYRTTS